MTLPLLLGLLACEPPPIVPPDPLGDDTDVRDGTGKKPGPFPWVEGVPRLSLSIFYENGFTDQLLIDDVTASYFIYNNDFTNQLTYSQTPDIDHIEGLSSDRIEHAGQGYIGGGIVRNEPADLSDWTVMHVSFKSDADAFDGLEVVLEGAGREGKVRVADYGFETDNEWHSLVLPMSAWADRGVDLSSLRIPFSIVAEGGNAGDILLVDDLYLTQEEPP